MRSSLVSLLAFVALAGVAHANPHAGKLKATREPTKPDAIEFMRRGNRAIAVNAYDTAIHQYQLGAIADAVPLFWLDLGLAYRRANRYTEAIDAYREFLARSAGDDDPDGIRDQVEQLIPQLEAARDAPPTHPTPISETSADTSAPATSSAAPTTSSAASSATVPTSAHDATTHDATTISTHASVSRWHDGPGWGLGGAGIVATGVGLYLLANASSLDDQADRETDFGQRDQLRQSASSRRTIGVVTAVSGGVLVAAAIARFALVGSPSTTSTSSLQLTPGPGDVGLGFALDF